MSQLLSRLLNAIPKIDRAKLLQAMSTAATTAQGGVKIVFSNAKDLANWISKNPNEFLTMVTAIAAVSGGAGYALLRDRDADILKELDKQDPSGMLSQQYRMIRGAHHDWGRDLPGVNKNASVRVLPAPGQQNVVPVSSSAPVMMTSGIDAGPIQHAIVNWAKGQFGASANTIRDAHFMLNMFIHMKPETLEDALNTYFHNHGPVMRRDYPGLRVS